MVVMQQSMGLAESTPTSSCFRSYSSVCTDVSKDFLRKERKLLTNGRKRGFAEFPVVIKFLTAATPYIAGFSRTRYNKSSVGSIHEHPVSCLVTIGRIAIHIQGLQCTALRYLSTAVSAIAKPTTNNLDIF